MILLYSGGLDSFIAWHFLERPKTLYCDLGHRYAVHEVNAIRKTISATIIDTRLRLDDLEQRDANIPLRNAFLIMIASYYDKNIALIVQKGEMNIPDRSVVFFSMMGNFLSTLWEEEVQVATPFAEMTKTDMVKWYIQSELDPDMLLKTRSCFSPGDIPCGNCAACFRRWVAFTNCGLSEYYANDITKYSGIQDYVKKMKAGEYDPDRTKETFDVLKKVGIL